MNKHLFVSAALVIATLCTYAQNTFPSSGSVGIGTTSPQQRLHVEGSSNQAVFVGTSPLGTTSGSAIVGYVKALPTATGQRLSHFSFGSRGGAQNNYIQAGMSGWAGGAWSSTSRPSYLTFETTTSGSISRQERLRITANGNVGIGTATPENTLHVFKGSAGSVSAFSTAPLVVENSANCYLHLLAPNASATGVLFGKPESNISAAIIYNDVSFNPNGFDFRTNGNVTKMVLNNAGNLGIGTLSPGAKLQIDNASNADGISVTNSYTGNTGHIGVYAQSIQANGFGYGVQGVGGNIGGYFEGYGGGSIGTAYGVVGVARGTAGTRYGVYGYADGGAVRYAGYFDGSVYTTGSYQPTARKLKTGIAPLNGSLEQLLKLKPSTYQYKTTEYKDMALPEGEQMGLIAEEVKEIFPQLVKAAVHPAKYGEDRKIVLSPEVPFEAVNYQGLIPLLIGSVQEQQQQIEGLRKENQQLKDQNEAVEARLAKLETLLTNSNHTSLLLSSAYLEQSAPNPARGSATIPYGVPDGSTSAKLILTNAKGQVLKTISINTRGAGQVNLNTAQLPSGTYTYTLWVDGEQAASKQLVIAR